MGNLYFAPTSILTGRWEAGRHRAIKVIAPETRRITMMGWGGMGWGGAGYRGAGYGGAGWGGMFAGFALFILALLVIAAIVYLYRRVNHGTPLITKLSEGGRDSHTAARASYRAGQGAATSPEDEAMSALAARLASGEITPEDYQERVATLRTVRDQGIDPTAGMPYLGPQDTARPDRRAA
ncbi:MAG: SHOCT domain-containing protein [Propionibacterium sp.]